MTDLDLELDAGWVPPVELPAGLTATFDDPPLDPLLERILADELDEIQSPCGCRYQAGHVIHDCGTHPDSRRRNSASRGGTPVEGAKTPDLFRRYTMQELMAADLTVHWLVRGVSMDPTYGQIAGELKTLKSTVASLVMASVASGEPLFGRFQVERAGPVLMYVGEGGRIPFTRRLVRVAQAIGVDPAQLPIVTTYDVAPVLSDRFQESVARDLAEIRPVMLALDPLYAYHGARTDSRNLHEEGGLLTSISAPCIEAGASCWIVNHFNQTGTGAGLKRITQAGSGEWADSWMLLAHRDTPDVPAGRFRLRLDIGSRQWGGTSWDLDLNLGAFDDLLGAHDGDITWDIRKADTAGGDNPRDRILAAVTTQPGRLLKEDLAKLAGGKLTDARHHVEALERQGVIWPQKVQGTRSDGRTSWSWRYFPTMTGTSDETPIHATSQKDVA